MSATALSLSQGTRAHSLILPRFRRAASGKTRRALERIENIGLEPLLPKAHFFPSPAARARGIKGGRRRTLNEAKRQRLYNLYDETNPNGIRKYAVKEVCEMMGVSKSTLYAYLAQR